MVRYDPAINRIIRSGAMVKVYAHSNLGDGFSENITAYQFRRDYSIITQEEYQSWHDKQKTFKSFDL